jgi:hypothetical protein
MTEQTPTPNFPAPRKSTFSGPSRAVALSAILCALLLISCAHVSTTTTQYVGAPHQPPSDPAKVELLRTQPTRPHDRLGEIVVDASTDPAPPITEVEEKLRKAAASIGADAAVIVYDRVQPVGVFVSGGYWNRTATTITGRKLVGVAIKYR